MLVLTRKPNQSIMIGDEIEISVLAIMGEKVRIGIEAPRAIPVFRKEVYLDIKSGEEASQRPGRSEAGRQRGRRATSKRPASADGADDAARRA